MTEPRPSITMDEYAAQPTLNQECPTCYARIGFSCTIPVRVWWDTEIKRQQVLSFHPARVVKVEDGS